jgi:hypothetical protein
MKCPDCDGTGKSCGCKNCEEIGKCYACMGTGEL